MAVMTITRSTIGQKVLMAATGVIWIGYLALHMWGNTKAFWGPVTFDSYAHHLRTFGEPILEEGQFLMAWRLVTSAALIVHIVLAFNLSRRNLQSRGHRYVVHKKVQADPAALTMKWGAIAIALFLLYHLMQFTWGVTAVLPSFDRATPYHNMISGFTNPINVIIYLVALAALGLHLYHGTWSLFQTLGWNSSRSNGGVRALAWAVALIICVGFALVPIAVSLGVLTYDSAPFMAV